MKKLWPPVNKVIQIGIQDKGNKNLGNKVKQHNMVKVIQLIIQQHIQVRVKVMVKVMVKVIWQHKVKVIEQVIKVKVIQQQHIQQVMVKVIMLEHLNMVEHLLMVEEVKVD